MPAIWHESGSPSFLGFAPQFSFHELAQIEAPAAWEVMEAVYAYERDVRPIAHDWAVERGREVWEFKKPWYCSL